MSKPNNSELLKIPEVVEEIKRHCWIESEKAGYDIGFDRAAQDWIKNYSQGWIEYHMPEMKNSTTPKNGKKPLEKIVKTTEILSKKRRAKSYSKV